MVYVYNRIQSAMKKTLMRVWVSFLVWLMAFILSLSDAVPLSDKQTIAKGRNLDFLTIAPTDPSTSTKTTTENLLSEFVNFQRNTVIVAKIMGTFIPFVKDGPPGSNMWIPVLDLPIYSAPISHSDVPHNPNITVMSATVWGKPVRFINDGPPGFNIWALVDDPQRRLDPVPSTFNLSTTATNDPSSSTNTTESNKPDPSAFGWSTTTTTTPTTKGPSTTANAIDITNATKLPKTTKTSDASTFTDASAITTAPKLMTTTKTSNTSTSTDAFVNTIEETIQVIHRVYHYKYTNESRPFKHTENEKRHLITADVTNHNGKKPTAKKSLTILKRSLQENAYAQKNSHKIEKLRNQRLERAKRYI